MMPTNKVNLGQSIFWHCWVGCHKVSEACENCFFCPQFDIVRATHPIKKPRNDLHYGTIVLTAFSSDFFIEEADEYREEAWSYIKEHPEAIFVLCTKRIERAKQCLPSDWEQGYDNVVIMVTAENQKRADERLPLLIELPCKHKWISAAPLLEEVNFEPFLRQGIEHIEVSGERGDFKNIRPLRYEWLVSLRNQCLEANTRLSIMHVGQKFIKDNETYTENAPCYRSPLATSLDLDVAVPLHFNLNNNEYIIP